MNIRTLGLVLGLLAISTSAIAQTATDTASRNRWGWGGWGGGGGRPCTPEPATMIGLSLVGLGVLRARMKKA